MKQQSKMATVTPNKETPRGNEALRSDWTIAALQRNSSLWNKVSLHWNRDLPALEQGEKERRLKGLIAPIPHNKELRLATSPSSLPNRTSQGGRAQQPEIGRAKIESQEVRAACRDSDRYLEGTEAETVQHRETQGLQRDRFAIGAIGETPRIGMVHKILRWLISLMVAASVAAVAGFATAIYAVPSDKAADLSNSDTARASTDRSWSLKPRKTLIRSKSAASRRALRQLSSLI